MTASPAPAGGGSDPALESLLDHSKQLYRLGRLLSSTLIRLRVRFDGDLDQYLIYMVFVLSDLSRRLQAKAGTVERSGLARGQAGLNALSVADITEIPRETTRRKLRLLVESGHLRLQPDHLYYLAEDRRPEDLLCDFAPLLHKLQPPA